MKRKREKFFTPSPLSKLELNSEKSLSKRFHSPKKRPKLDFNLAVRLFDEAPAQTAPDLQSTLLAAMRHANTVCRLGANNKTADIYHTNGWCLGQRFHHNGRFLNKKIIPPTPRDEVANVHYSEMLGEDNVLTHKLSDGERWDWYYHQEVPESDASESVNPPISIDKGTLNFIPYIDNQDPLNDPRFNLSPENKEILKLVIMAKDMRYGNCGIRSLLALDWLWRHSKAIKRLEYIGYSFDHACIFVNREGDSMDSGWVIDPWWEEGKIYPVSEFVEKFPAISVYCKKQTRELYELLGIDYEETSEAPAFEVHNEILPEIDQYPSADPHKSISDYYYLSNMYPLDIVPQLGKLKTMHQEKFNPVLAELHSHAVAINQNRFFAMKKAEKSNDDGYLDFCAIL